MKYLRYIILCTFLLSGCCVKIVEVEQHKRADGTYEEEVVGYRSECSMVITLPGGKSIKKVTSDPAMTSENFPICKDSK